MLLPLTLLLPPLPLPRLQGLGGVPWVAKDLSEARQIDAAAYDAEVAGGLMWIGSEALCGWVGGVAEWVGAAMPTRRGWGPSNQAL